MGLVAAPSAVTRADFQAFLASHRFKTLTQWLLHAYFAIGLLFLGWATDLVLFGYFIEACVQLVFGWWILLLAGREHRWRRLFSFSWKAIFGLILYFIFLLLFDLVMKEPYRSDTLFIKLALTLESVVDPAMQGEDFFINLFDRQMRNEFVIESAIAFFLTLLAQVTILLQHRQRKTVPEVSMLSLVQFWFLFGLAALLVGYFKIPLTLGWFLIVARILFDHVASGENERIRTKLAKQFVYHMIVLFLTLVIVADCKDWFERTMAAFGAATVLLGTSSIVARDKNDDDFPLWEKILLIGEALLLLLGVISPSLLPGEKQSFIARMPSKSYVMCRFGSKDACAEYGEDALAKKADWDKIKEAMDLLSRTCAANHFASCYHLGVFYIDQIGGVKTEPGIQLLEKSCTGGYGWACMRLAKNDEALRIFTGLCDAGKREWCHPAGRVYENMRKDNQSALGYYQKGCTLEDAKSCNAVGYFLSEYQKELREGARYYLIGCRSGNYTACANAGNMYRDGSGVKKDADHAYSLYAISCDKGKEGFGCYQLARFIRAYGVYGTKDESSKRDADDRMRKACRYGYRDACLQ